MDEAMLDLFVLFLRPRRGNTDNLGGAADAQQGQKHDVHTETPQLSCYNLRLEPLMLFPHSIQSMRSTQLEMV